MILQENITQFFSSWLESIRLFKPKTFKPFILVTLKATVTTISHLFKKFWWLYTLVFLIGILDSLGFIELWYSAKGPIILLRFFIEWILQIAALYILILTVRPSVGIKSYRYYFQSIPSVIFVYSITLVVLISFLFGFLLLGLVLSKFFPLIVLIAPLMNVILMVFNAKFFVFLQPPSFLFPNPFHISPLLLFITFFYFDSDRSVKQVFLSIWRGLKMLFYNYPFCLLSFILFYYGMFSIHNSAFFIFGRFAQESLWVMVGIRLILLFFIPFIICYFNNFYIKKAHEQFTLYFE